MVGSRPPSRIGVQRQPGTSAAAVGRQRSRKRRDIAVLLTRDKGDLIKAKVMAQGAIRIRVDSVADLTAKLRRLAKQHGSVGTVSFFGHSLPSGDIGISTKGGGTRYVPPSEFRDALAAANLKASTLDFQGCSVGRSPKALDSYRKATGAASARGTTCYLVSQPFQILDQRRKPITNRRHLRAAGGDAYFTAAMNRLRQASGSRKWASVVNKDQAGYFRAGGNFVAVWANPSLSTQWDERKSVPYTKLTVESLRSDGKPKADDLSGRCSIVEVKGEQVEP